jgi:two-component system sensor histidine kinase BaeS
MFVLLQASYLVHSPPAAMGSGVTFAEFARRGFGQLSFAATLVGAIILILEYTRPGTVTERERSTLRRLELALIIAVELVLISAFRRVILYEQAYGFTTARLVAQAYMIAMALALVALALEIGREKISLAFGRRVAEIALGAFTVLALWNFEGWIVNKNIDRAQATGKFDALYASRLSSDAIPTLAQRRADIPQPARDSVDMRFSCKQIRTERRWFEWNRSVNEAAAALRNWPRPPCPKPTVRGSELAPVPD